MKLVTRHVWEDYMEQVEDIRYTLGNKTIYQKRKETIERIFGTAKEHHGFRYTQYRGKARMEMKAGLTFACMNLKKLVRILAKKGILSTDFSRLFHCFYEKWKQQEKRVPGMIAKYPLCLQSENPAKQDSPPAAGREAANSFPPQCDPCGALFRGFLCL